MISPSEAYSFIAVNAAILENSGININMDRVKASVDNGTFTKKDFLSYIEDEISRFIYQWYINSETRKSLDVNSLIINVRKSGKDFKYTFLRDVKPFKNCEVESIEQGIEDSLIVSFADGELYRMTFPLKRSCLDRNNIILTRIDNLPKEFDAADLKDTILQILKPVIEFEHEYEDTSVFIKHEFLKLIPFENHSWIKREDELQVSNWEYCILHGPWRFTRDRVKIILNMFISALKEYADDASAPNGWGEIVHSAIQSIKSLYGIVALTPRLSGHAYGFDTATSIAQRKK